MMWRTGTADDKYPLPMASTPVLLRSHVFFSSLFSSRFFVPKRDRQRRKEVLWIVLWAFFEDFLGAPSSVFWRCAGPFFSSARRWRTMNFPFSCVCHCSPIAPSQKDGARHCAWLAPGPWDLISLSPNVLDKAPGSTVPANAIRSYSQCCRAPSRVLRSPYSVIYSEVVNRLLHHSWFFEIFGRLAAPFCPGLVPEAARAVKTLAPWGKKETATQR